MYSTGFAANTADFLSKLNLFLTTTLPALDRWTQLRYITTAGQEELILQGSGTGTNQIIIGFKHYYNDGTANSELILQHFTSFNNTKPFYEQAGGIAKSQNYICIPLISPALFLPNLIKYWFIANSRHVKIVVKIGLTYHYAYLGYIHPYTSPIDWPEPVCVGGSSLADFNGIPIRYYETTYTATSAFWNPANGYFPAKFDNVGTLLIKNSSGSHRRLYNYIENSYLGLAKGTYPYMETLRNMYGQFNTISTNNNNYHLLPIMIVDNEGSGIYGEFEGIKFVTGHGLNSEDTITINGTQWLCVPNVYIISPNNWAAFKLE